MGLCLAGLATNGARGVAVKAGERASPFSGTVSSKLGRGAGRVVGDTTPLAAFARGRAERSAMAQPRPLQRAGKNTRMRA